MKISRQLISLSLIFGVTFSLLADQTEKQVQSKEAVNRAPKVELKKNDAGYWRLYVNDIETPIRGAGGVIQPGMLENFKRDGGNFTRTWGVETLDEKVTGGMTYADKAHELGIHVTAGIWIGHERHGFDYSNQEQLQKQRDMVREVVRKWKNHPAIVIWGLGNEMEDPAIQIPNPEVFKELEILAKIIKEEDPGRPVMSVIAGSGAAKVKGIMEHYPSIDILGVNSYGAAAGTGEALVKHGWSKPFAITEFGVRGFWEVSTTSWGAPIEPNSSEKASTYYATHKLVCDLNEGKEMCLGTYAFLWGWKQEKTSTWFGMYLPSMEKLPQVDAMVKAWTGKWPEQRCPKIISIEKNIFGKTLPPNKLYVVEVKAVDKNGDDLSYDWLVVEESLEKSVGGDKESVPPSHPKLTVINGTHEGVFRSPAKAGAYRLFLTIRDGKGGAATANIPFQVQ